jgi:hypothetical protein
MCSEVFIQVMFKIVNKKKIFIIQINFITLLTDTYVYIYVINNITKYFAIIFLILKILDLK